MKAAQVSGKTLGLRGNVPMTDDDILREYSKLRRRLFRPRVKASRFQKLKPPATPAEVAAAEVRLGYTLPPLLRRLYIEVGDGGFGPGYGVLGVGAGGLRDSLGNDLVDGREKRRKAAAEDETFPWPHEQVAFCEWGCAIFSCADLSLGDVSPVTLFDPMIVPPDSSIAKAFVPHGLTLREFLAGWIQGKDLWVPHETVQRHPIVELLQRFEPEA